MATIIEMPKLSDTMSEGKILTWLKHEGDEVESGEVLAEIESDKANMEMTAYDSGFLRKVLVPEGGSAPVGAAIAIVTESADEDIGEVLGRVGSGTAAPKKKAAEADAKAGKQREAGTAKSPPLAGAGPPASSPDSRRAPPEARPSRPGTPPSSPGTSSPGGRGRRETPEPVLSATAPARVRSDGHGKVLASPLAFRMASELGLDLRAIRGTGPEGRIVKRDVEQALAGSPAEAGAAAPPGPETRPDAEHEDLPVSSMRRIIADRLVESTTTAPHYFVTMEVDMGAATRAREELNQVEGVSISLNDFIVKAVAIALVKHPALNASWRGTTIRRFKSVDIGVAVALEDGLITPIVRACHEKSLGRISLETKDLIARAREKKLRPEEFKGGTFTVSNLGMLGVKQFTAIINPPEACILAVGAIEDVPVIKDGAVVPGRRMSMTLSSDHRLVDGAEAAKFLREVKSLLERPVSLAL